MRRSLASAAFLVVALTAGHVPSARAAAGCSIFSSTLNFGNYDVLSPAPTDSTTTILIICVRNPPPGNETISYTLSLSVGAGSYAARRLSNGPSTIQYNLYTSPAMTLATVWGNGTGGSTVVGATLPRLTGGNPIQLATHTIYGRLPPGQDVPVGTYTGNVVLTMNW